ncbi:ABC transporter permease [Streptomyces sp. NPDC050610]|uniref:ABC transporter permease n=1 Tax=Streptomyces sp. NPDC050610 TaxID=3157097 RepID=UPI00341B9471
MKERGVSGQLMRVGRAADRRAEAGRVRFIALLAATALLALGIAAMLTAHAGYQGQAGRGIARNPIAQEDRPDLPGTALWAKSTDSVPGSGFFSIVFITPLTAEAPLPPGLSAWPAPGEAVLSPRLRRLGAEDGIATRYGRATAEIGDAGLQSPDELLAYIRPRVALPAGKATNIVGYGRPAHASPVRLGQLAYAKPEWTFQIMPGVLVLLPVAVLLVVAARSGSHSRDRRTALVSALGGTPRARALIVLGEVSLPVLAGSLIAAAVVGAFCTTDVRLPGTGFVVSAVDVRAWWWELLLGVAASAAVVVAASVAASRLSRATGGSSRTAGGSSRTAGGNSRTAGGSSRTAGGNRPTGTRRSPTRWAVLCPVFLLIAVRGPDLFAAGTPANVLINWVGAAATLITLPAAIAVLIARLGRLMSTAGRRFGRPGLLVAGHRVAAHPGPTARMTAAVVVSLGLLIQVVAWQGLFGETARAAQATVDRIGSSALYMQPGAATPQQMEAFVRRLPSTEQAVQLISSGGQPTTTLQGTCQGLTALRLPCSRRPVTLSGVPKDPRVREIIDWSASGSTTVVVRELTRAAAPATSDAEGIPPTILVSVDGHDLPVSALKQLAYQVFPKGAAINTAGGEWLVAGQLKRSQGLWITFFGFIGILVLAGASVISGTAEFLRNGRALAPISVLSGNRRVYWSTAAWSLLVPFVLAGSAGCLVGTWLAFPKTADGSSFISGSFLAACALGVSVMGLLAWGWGANVAARQAAAWRPRGD